MATYPGDFNLDGVVDNLDRNIWFANAFTGSTWQQGDANHDGVVDGLDRDLWFSHVGLPCWPLPRSAAGFTPCPSRERSPSWPPAYRPGGLRPAKTEMNRT